jgi:hypothetical protein
MHYLKMKIIIIKIYACEIINSFDSLNLILFFFVNLLKRFSYIFGLIRLSKKILNKMIHLIVQFLIDSNKFSN